MKTCTYCFALLLFLIFGCNQPEPKNSTPSVNPYESALPHGSSPPAEQLSIEDQQKLKSGFGRTVDSLSLESLNWMLDSLGGRLNVINFWSLSCNDCAENNQILEKAQMRLGDSIVYIHHVNVDDLELESDVIGIIRGQGLVNPCWMLQTEDPFSWPGMIQPNWDGSLPAMVLVNQEEGIRLFYQKVFTEEELTTLFQPFIL